jgi:hypothetical protein
MQARGRNLLRQSFSHNLVQTYRDLATFCLHRPTLMGGPQSKEAGPATLPPVITIS